MTSAKTTKQLKISDLAKKAGVTIPTIRHYLKEGLLPRPVKTGQTMAYYDPDCIDRIRLIKRLQRERFLPIEVIKRLINAGDVSTEESEIGQILTRSNLFQAGGGRLTAEELKTATGYPFSKIRKLNREGIVVPRTAESGHCYDALDAELIKLIQKAEEAGLPSDFTLGTIRMYEEAVDAVISKNTRRMLACLITDIPAEDMGRVLTETEASLDALLLLLRQKSVRRINESAVGELNTMGEKLDAMIFFPVAGKYLPDTVPDEPWEKIFYDFCTGNYSRVPNDCNLLPEDQAGRWSLICAMLAHLCLKDVKSAVKLAETRLPEPVNDPMINSIAALTYVYDTAFSAGIVGPMKQLKKAWPFLERSQRMRKGSKLDQILTQYVCGAVYTAMPDIFDLGKKGRILLVRAVRAIRGKFAGQGIWPQWAALTLSEEIMPAVEDRVNRVLARWYTENMTENVNNARE